jgi:hypothetical protein
MLEDLDAVLERIAEALRGVGANEARREESVSSPHLTSPGGRGTLMRDLSANIATSRLLTRDIAPDGIPAPDPTSNNSRAKPCDVALHANPAKKAGSGHPAPTQLSLEPACPHAAVCSRHWELL